MAKETKKNVGKVVDDDVFNSFDCGGLVGFLA